MASRRAPRLIVLALFFWLVALPMASAQATGCASRFPNVSWATVSEGPVLSLYSAGIEPAVAARFEADAVRVTRWLGEDLGIQDQTSLCLFGPGVTLSPDGIVPFGQQIHSVALGPESVVVISTADLKRVQGAIGYGLAYSALWQAAEASGLAGYPQPLADAVSQWYMARVTDSLEAHHSMMVRGNFLQDPSGTRPPTDWTAAGPQAAVFAWNPQFSESPIGDMVGFAVASRGSQVLLDPTEPTWASVESEYRAALNDELLGDVGGSFGWPWGLAIVIIVLVLAVVLSSYEWRRKRKLRERRPVLEPPAEGMFET